ncbi:hypothetical protein [Foetidibacter luteolus]|uniref:hypothetical protein n=1 Tax=Foetidibacter luteolus TaxID=2608880 RepID=UPI00129BA3B4|nr:hypothetical protein [Foetidibacter luteolus]
MADSCVNAKMSLKELSAGLKEPFVTLEGYFLWLKLTTLHVELAFLWLTGYYAGLKFYCAWLKGAFL